MMQQANRSWKPALGALLALATLAGPSRAGPVLFLGIGTDSESPAPLSASAQFQVVGTNLVVTLTNTSLLDVDHQSQGLTAVFFDLTGNPSLGSGSAVLAPGSSVINPSPTYADGSTPNPNNGTDPGGVVGGEWAFSGPPLGGGLSQDYGISSSGLTGAFGSPTFPGNDLYAPLSVDGIQYAITSAGDNPTTGNKTMRETPLIQNSVVFTLTGISPSFDPFASVSNVRFQYGTGLNESHFNGTGIPVVTPVPEPSTFLGALSGLIPLGLVALRRHRRRAIISE